MTSLFIASLLICILFPIGGVFLIIAMYLGRNTTNRKGDDDSFKDDVNEVEYNFIPDINIDKDSDTIPLIDSLELSSLKSRRETVLDILKKDAYKYIDFLKLAIKNDDSETTHYVATNLLHTKIDLDQKLIKARKTYLEDSLNIENNMDYIDVLNKYITLPYVDEKLKIEYINENIKVLSTVVDKNQHLDPKYIINLIELLLESNRLEDARNYCSFLLQNYPDSEEKYLILLKCFYIFKDKENFNSVLTKFKQELLLSKSTLNLVRFWLGGII